MEESPFLKVYSFSFNKGHIKYNLLTHLKISLHEGCLEEITLRLISSTEYYLEYGWQHLPAAPFFQLPRILDGWCAVILFLDSIKNRVAAITR